MSQQQPEEFKILIIGESGVGKTSISKRFKDDEFKSVTRETTVATVWKKGVEVEGREVQLVIYDTGGHPTFRALIVANYFREADGVLLVYDVSDSRTFDTLSEWLQQVTDLNPSATLLVVGNKSDEEDSKKKISTESVEGFLQDNNLDFVETSAKSGQNVQKVFEKLTQKILVKKQSAAAALLNAAPTQEEAPEEETPEEDLSEDAPPTHKECEDGTHEENDHDVPPTPQPREDSRRRNSAPPTLPYSLLEEEEEESFVLVDHLPPVLRLPPDEVSALTLNRFRKMSSDSLSSLAFQNEEFEDMVREHREAQQAQKPKDKCSIL